MALRFVLLLVAAAGIGGLIGYGMHARESNVVSVVQNNTSAPVLTPSPEPPPAASPPTPQPVVTLAPTAAAPTQAPATANPATPAPVKPVPATAAPATAAPATPVTAAAARTSAPAAPSDEPPRILDVTLPAVVHENTTASGVVMTTPNITTMTASVQGFNVDVPRSGPGRFTISYPIPPLPVFIKGNWSIQLIGKTSAGATATRTVTVNLQ